MPPNLAGPAREILSAPAEILSPPGEILSAQRKFSQPPFRGLISFQIPPAQLQLRTNFLYFVIP